MCRIVDGAHSRNARTRETRIGTKGVIDLLDSQHMNATEHRRKDYFEPTCTHAGPDNRTTAIAARPGAVDNAYIVESVSKENRKRGEVEKLWRALDKLRGSS